MLGIPPKLTGSLFTRSARLWKSAAYAVALKSYDISLISEHRVQLRNQFICTLITNRILYKIRIVQWRMCKYMYISLTSRVTLGMEGILPVVPTVYKNLQTSLHVE